MTNEDREEFYQDLLEEAREEEYLEAKLKDYDEFCDYFIEDIELLREAIKTVKQLHDSYNHEFDLKDFE